MSLSTTISRRASLLAFSLTTSASRSTIKGSKVLYQCFTNPPVITRGVSTRTSAPVGADLATFKVPTPTNEPMRPYGPGSLDRKLLSEAIDRLRSKVAAAGPSGIRINPTIGGEEVLDNDAVLLQQRMPAEHNTVLCTFAEASPATVKAAIRASLAAKAEWESTPFADRAAVFLKAADLLTGKYRYDVLAATMLGQGKNTWQAEIDAACELADFWRFNTSYAQDIYSQQPPVNAPATWNRTEYRPLEGFVAAYSPFNFTAIAGNLVGAPALMGNVVVWKPSPHAMYSNYLVHQILLEAGLPPDVVQFVPGDAVGVSNVVFNSPSFAGLHFTGSTAVFRQLWKRVGSKIHKYNGYPRLVGETGGKNFHFIHESADIKNAALQTIRGAFEYNGQKCSATSRVYVPKSKMEEFKGYLVEEVARIKLGSPDESENFMTAVINEQSFDKISSFISNVGSEADLNSKVIAGGKCDKSKGYFIQPTVIETTDPKAPTMVNELFGPVVTLFAYDDHKYESALRLADKTSKYGLTGSIFAKDRSAIATASSILREAAGNIYINDKSTGAIVGQQPFGGARQSGTNDKAGSALNLYRWISPRTIKETFLPITEILYPSNKV